MEFTDPYEIDAPPGTRHVGDGPFWMPGDTVTWSFRRFDFDRDHAEVRRPMHVIEDGPAGAVLWMAGGTETTDTRIVGWEECNPHDVPLKERFRPPAEAPRRIKAPGSWRGLGVLKVVPPGVPFSVWVLLKPGVQGLLPETMLSAALLPETLLSAALVRSARTGTSTSKPPIAARTTPCIRVITSSTSHSPSTACPCTRSPGTRDPGTRRRGTLFSTRTERCSRT